MSLSFREVANFMDPVVPASGIQRLVRVHRWPGGEPRRPLSLRAVLSRHWNTQKVTQTFLFYNTFLLPNVELPIIDYIVERMIPDIPGFPDPIDVLEKEVREVLETVLPSPKIIPISKPALRPRAREIGEAIHGAYDIAALCETFDASERKLILQAWPREQQPSLAAGPTSSGSWVVLGSGLVTISTQREIRSQQHTFDERGQRLRDTDAWANKGVLLSVIDLGVGKSRLEVYSTHLLSGDDFEIDLTVDLPRIGTVGIGGTPSREEKLRIQLKQVDEVKDFVTRTHQPENVAIIVGDFNIDAHDQALYTIGGVARTPYDHLVSRMQALNMYDLWAARSRDKADGATFGYTSNIKDQKRTICAVDSRDEGYCDDLTAPEQSGTRIDYIFVQEQRPEHGLMLDFTRPRRVSFERPPNAEGYDKIGFMSDHVGLAVTLIATPA